MSYASLCVLSYQRPTFLAQCIETIRQHAAYPFELIVHDDGSEDPAVYHYLRDEHEQGRISTLIVNPPGHNQGVGTAINRMFNLASGETLVKLDSDLLMHPGFLAKAAEILDRNRDAHEPRIGVLGLLHYHHDPVDSAKTKIKDWGYMQQHTHILGSAFAVPRDVWQRHGPLGEHSDSFSEDWKFMDKITALPDHCCALPIEDLCTNQGMGIESSTVVTHDGVQPIHHGPVLFS